MMPPWPMPSMSRARIRESCGVSARVSRAWLLEGISNGAKREVKASLKKKKKKKSRRRSRSRSRSSSRAVCRWARDLDRDHEAEMMASGPSTTTRGSRSARDRSCGSARTTARSGQWELDGHTVGGACALKKEHQIEICEHLRSFPLSPRERSRTRTAG